MWDATFAALSPAARAALDAGDAAAAFDAMHAVLDDAWAEVARVLVPGGFACVNIGDATRTLGRRFALHPNHARVALGLQRAGLTLLPEVLWRKPTNAPTKFLGSGMLPAGAYITYEHEYVLVARKGGPRAFSRAERPRRAAGAYFWEERNQWFSDVWDKLPGAPQARGGGGRARTGAFPFELPFRLIQMYSLPGDTVLDPFAGTGTTLAAAAASGRSSVGVERDAALAPAVAAALAAAPAAGRARAAARWAAHLAFAAARAGSGRPLRHLHASGHPVMTRQESTLTLWAPAGVAAVGPTAWESTAAPVAPPPAPPEPAQPAAAKAAATTASTGG
jgi:DNA modification methylase